MTIERVSPLVRPDNINFTGEPAPTPTPRPSIDGDFLGRIVDLDGDEFPDLGAGDSFGYYVIEVHPLYHFHPGDGIFAPEQYGDMGWTPRWTRESPIILRGIPRFYPAEANEGPYPCRLMENAGGTAEGLIAIEKCLALGININVTLLFSVSRYERVIAAYFAGQQQRLVRNMPLDRLASVASFFVSRVDGKVDPMLDKIGTPEAKALKGTIAVANAQVAYERFEHAFRGSDWRVLARKGARPQRPLWASTSTKNPAYQDTIYVEGLIAPHTVNTLPPETMNAYRDHGSPAVRIPEQIPEARSRLEALAACGVDLAAVTEALEKEGVEKFALSYKQLLSVVEKKAAQLTGV